MSKLSEDTLTTHFKGVFFWGSKLNDSLDKQSKQLPSNGLTHAIQQLNRSSDFASKVRICINTVLTIIGVEPASLIHNNNI
jgi:hypothetical protein